MSDSRAEYTVTIGGVEHSMLLSDEDAKRLGDAAKKGAPTKEAPTPKNKARTASNK